jgi:DNA-directed RNA polymerase specialized sigma subunit
MNYRENQTQTEVANKMGISQGDLSNIEKKGNCLLSTFKKYIDACGKRMIIIKKGE